jgi:hypothetical protein
MNLESFLEQKDVLPLLGALTCWFKRINTVEERQNVFETADIHDALFSNLRFDTNAQKFANALIAEFKKYSFSFQRPNYHPMVNLLKHMCDRTYVGIDELPEQDFALFKQLVDQGQEKLKALAARSSVGCIESPKKTGIGTGILVGKDLLLTCNHVFSKSQVQQALVRFNYFEGNYLADSDVSVFELDLDLVSYDNQLDYALVRIKGEPRQTVAKFIDAFLNTGQEISIMHHPQGKPMVISQLGKIIEAEEDYLIAIHRGELGSSHPAASRHLPNVTSGTPVRCFWSKIKGYLT